MPLIVPALCVQPRVGDLLSGTYRPQLKYDHEQPLPGGRAVAWARTCGLHDPPCFSTSARGCCAAQHRGCLMCRQLRYVGSGTASMATDDEGPASDIVFEELPPGCCDAMEE